MNADAKRCFLLKVHKRENFFGSDYEFFNMVLLTIKKKRTILLFSGIFFFIGPLLEKLRSYRAYSVYAERGFSCKSSEKFFLQKSQI